MELENQGRGPHFVSAHRDDSSVIREQVLSFFCGFKQKIRFILLHFFVIFRLQISSQIKEFYQVKLMNFRIF